MSAEPTGLVDFDFDSSGIHPDDCPRIIGRLPVSEHLRPKPPRVTRANRCQRIVRIPRDWGIEKRFVIDWIDPQEAAGWYVEGEA
jgi:hypothetical protein